jgi:hypothetical protein
VSAAAEFEGRLDVGETYDAVLVRPVGTEVWLPATPGSASPSPDVHVTWVNPEALAGLADRDPPDRRVVFEVVNRDIDRPSVYYCRVTRVGR